VGTVVCCRGNAALGGDERAQLVELAPADRDAGEEDLAFRGFSVRR